MSWSWRLGIGEGSVTDRLVGTKTSETYGAGEPFQSVLSLVNVFD